MPVSCASTGKYCEQGKLYSQSWYLPGSGTITLLSWWRVFLSFICVLLRSIVASALVLCMLIAPSISIVFTVCSQKHSIFSLHFGFRADHQIITSKYLNYKHIWQTLAMILAGHHLNQLMHLLCILLWLITEEWQWIAENRDMAQADQLSKEELNIIKDYYEILGAKWYQLILPWFH